MYTKIQVVFDAAEPEKLAEFWGLGAGLRERSGAFTNGSSRGAQRA